MTIFVNWESKIILNQKEIAEEIKRRVDHVRFSNSSFESFLQNKYSHNMIELYELEDVKKKEVFSEFMAEARDTVQKEVMDEYKKLVIEE